jgi:hypothetical protein
MKVQKEDKKPRLGSITENLIIDNVKDSNKKLRRINNNDFRNEALPRF